MIKYSPTHERFIREREREAKPEEVTGEERNGNNRISRNWIFGGATQQHMDYVWISCSQLLLKNIYYIK